MNRTCQTFGLILVALNLVWFSTPASAQEQVRNKPIKVILKVEGEGTLGQTAKELPSAELDELRSLISLGLEKLSNHTLVSPDDKGDAVGLLIAAEKLQCGRETYYLVSSVVTLAEAKGTDEFVTHNVFAEMNLEVAAKAVVAQLSMIELHIGLGLR